MGVDEKMSFKQGERVMRIDKLPAFGEKEAAGLFAEPEKKVEDAGVFLKN